MWRLGLPFLIYQHPNKHHVGGRSTRAFPFLSSNSASSIHPSFSFPHRSPRWFDLKGYSHHRCHWGCGGSDHRHIGLTLHFTKCEVIQTREVDLTTPLDSFTVTLPEDTCFFGASLSVSGDFEATLEMLCSEISLELSRLTNLTKYDAIIPSMSSLSSSALVHSCSAPTSHPVWPNNAQGPRKYP